jgi:putative ABC transport system substrate-binding protein
VIQNAEGSLASAQSIAENFHAHQKIDAIYAIATPAVQAAARAEKEKPIFIAAVTDPESLGIIHPRTNICGTTDRIDTEAQADLILKAVPTAQTAAIIYNPGENNSQIMVKNMERSLQKRGLKTLPLGVHSESEIAQTISAAAHKAEVILVPADNLLVGAMPLVAREALKRGRPLFASDLPSVAKGALAAQGADYAELGKTTAQMASRVLILGESPETVGIVHPFNTKLVTNPKVMEALGISFQEELCSDSF